MSVVREVKVGVFVLAGMCVLGAVIFLIGEERRAFASKGEYQTVFNDVQGLRRGSPVRMGGVDIGSVSEVSYGNEANDRKIYVRMAIVDREARRIRADSVASIEAKGLLGDKMIAITVGTPGKPELPDGASIPSREGGDLSEVMGKVGNITASVEKIVNNLEQTTGSFASDEFQSDIKNGVGALSRILVSVERGDGYVGRLFKDPQEAERLSNAVRNLEHASANFDQASRTVNQILAQVQSGPGLAHEVLYGSESSKAIAQFGGAADELTATLRGIREGDGLAKSVLYGGDPQTKEIVANLSAASEDFKAIASGLRAGKGTLGALLVDPSVYEDLKLVLGNVERNKALRALVRYSIRRDGTPPKVEDPDPGSDREGSAGSSPKIGGALEGAVKPKLGGDD
jgi:phospholipid/cholesterol/gamma-HCH transport system substrate-binding protein